MKKITFFTLTMILALSIGNLLAQTVAVNITFQADMTDLLEAGFDPNIHFLELRGGFNDWAGGDVLQPYPINDSLYVITKEITGVAGDTVEWKFRAYPGQYFVNNGWEIEPGGGHNGNRQLALPASDSTLAPVLPDIYFKDAITVNSTDDTGDVNPGDGICDDGTGNCTLRAAIEEANSIWDTDLIAFDIPGTAPYTFHPFSAYPWITNPVVIDGTTEPDFAGTPVIELDGSNAGNANGLSISAGNSIVRGLVINRFSDNGIGIAGGGENTIEGNFIGTDITGTVSLGNGNAGTYVGSNNNIIGGTTSEAGNIIAFNYGVGVGVWGGTGNSILYNSLYSNTYLGIDLGNFGVTPNDPGDADSGPNNLQNFPEIVVIAIDESGDLWIDYFVDSYPAYSTYPITVQFFKADNEGEGQIYFGTDTFSEANYYDGNKSANLGNADELGVSDGDLIVVTDTDDNGNTSEFSLLHATGIDEQATYSKADFLLYNYPNPFTGSTTIVFSLPDPCIVKFGIYDHLGRKVNDLSDQFQEKGEHQVTWDAHNYPSGIYFYKLQAGDQAATGKMVLMR